MSPVWRLLMWLHARLPRPTVHLERRRCECGRPECTQQVAERECRSNDLAHFNCRWVLEGGGG